MEFQTRKEGHATVVAVTGRLDAVTTPDYEKHISELIASGATCFVIDLQRLNYISSAGLRGLLVTAHLLKEKNGKLCLANANGNVRSVFDMCRIEDLFKMEDSIAAAIAAVA